MRAGARLRELSLAAREGPRLRDAARGALLPPGAPLWQWHATGAPAVCQRPSSSAQPSQPDRPLPASRAGTPKWSHGDCTSSHPTCTEGVPASFPCSGNSRLAETDPFRLRASLSQSQSQSQLPSQSQSQSQPQSQSQSQSQTQTQPASPQPTRSCGAFPWLEGTFGGQPHSRPSTCQAQAHPFGTATATPQAHPWGTATPQAAPLRWQPHLQARVQNPRCWGTRPVHQQPAWERVRLQADSLPGRLSCLTAPLRWSLLGQPIGALPAHQQLPSPPECSVPLAARALAALRSRPHCTLEPTFGSSHLPLFPPPCSSSFGRPFSSTGAPPRPGLRQPGPGASSSQPRAPRGVPGVFRAEGPEGAREEVGGRGGRKPEMGERAAAPGAPRGVPAAFMAEEADDLVEELVPVEEIQGKEVRKPGVGGKKGAPAKGEGGKGGGRGGKEKGKGGEEKGSDQPRLNRLIVAPWIRLVTEEGHVIVSRADALKRAHEAGLDLMEVNARADPPVCRLLDFRRFAFEQRKKEKDMRRKQVEKRRMDEIKDVRISTRTERRDLEMKAEMAERHLQRGHRVKCTLIYTGSEKRLGIEDPRFQDMLKLLQRSARIEIAPRNEGHKLWCMVRPLASAPEGGGS